MSVRAMAAVFESSNLPPVPRLVLLALADHADDEGYAWPSIDRLTHKTGLDRRTVQRALVTAEDSGELTRTIGAGRRNTSLYRITVDSVDISPDFSTKSGTVTPFTDEKRRRSRREKAAETTIKGGTLPPEPSINHKEPRAASSAIVFPPVDPAHVEKVAEVRRALNEPPA